MKAAKITAERCVEIVEVPDPRLLGPAGAIVKVEATGICGSDLHLYHGALPPGGLHPGHEVVGTIVEVGPLVRERQVGDRVLVSAVVGCGACLACRTGDPIACPNGGPVAFGTTGQIDGGQAEFLSVPAADLFTIPVPADIDVESAVLLTDILPTGFLGAQMAAIEPGDTVAIFGMGPVGIMALAAAQLFGPSRILAVDMVPERLARAAAMGAEPIDATGGLGALGVLEATQGRGVDAAIEAVGARETVTDAINSVSARGRISMVGVNLEMDFPFPMASAFFKALSFRAAFAAIPSTWANLVPLVTSGVLDLGDVVTHHMGLTDAAEAYAMFDRRDDGVFKILLDPSR